MVRGLWLCDEPRWGCCHKAGANAAFAEATPAWGGWQGLSSSLCLSPSSGYSMSSQISKAGYQHICVLTLASSCCHNTSISHLLCNLASVCYISNFPLTQTSHFRGPDTSYSLPAVLLGGFQPRGCCLASPQAKQNRPWWAQAAA